MVQVSWVSRLNHILIGRLDNGRPECQCAMGIKGRGGEGCRNRTELNFFCCDILKKFKVAAEIR